MEGWQHVCGREPVQSCSKLQLYHVPVGSPSSWNRFTLPVQVVRMKILPAPARTVGACPRDDPASGAKGQDGMRGWDWVRPVVMCHSGHQRSPRSQAFAFIFQCNSWTCLAL